MADALTTWTPPYTAGYSPWAPAVVAMPAAMPPQAAPTADYASLLDQLHLSSQLPTYVTPPAPPTVQLFPVLSGLLERLQDLVDRLFSPAPGPKSPQPTPSTRPTEFVISSFNVLGSSHTKPGGEKPYMAPGPERIHSAVSLLDAHHVDVVGFQELQGDQLKEFQRIAGDRYAVYPGFKLGKQESVNSIAWRKDTWELVKPGSIDIPYFNGSKRKMPVVLLRNRKTGQEAYFANFHNPADTARFHQQEMWRDQATQLEISLVNRLRRESGLPVFVTGDMNESKEYYDRLTGSTEMVAANEGPKGKAPRQMGIDWIFGSPDVTFSGYTRDRGAQVKQTSDHPMVVSKARIGG